MQAKNAKNKVKVKLSMQKTIKSNSKYYKNMVNLSKKSSKVARMSEK